MSETKTAYLNRFSLELPCQAVIDCSYSSPCDEDVQSWASKINRPKNITRKQLAAELKEYGSWNAKQLSDDNANWLRIIWLAAGNIKEREQENERQSIYQF